MLGTLSVDDECSKSAGRTEVCDECLNDGVVQQAAGRSLELENRKSLENVTSCTGIAR